MDLIGMGFEMMGLGLVGVFGVLIIFYIIIKALLKMFPSKDEA